MVEFIEVEMPKEFIFPVACTNIAVSGDGKKMVAGGVYKPTIKFFDLKTGVMKYERHLVTDSKKIVILDNEAEKFAVLRNDKNVEFHLKSGMYEKLSTPFQPKDLVINPIASELYFVGNSSQMLRFNLEQGRFLKNVENGKGNKVSFSSQHGLIAIANENSLNFIDSRSKELLFTKQIDSEITSITQDNTGLKYAIGTENGSISEYDFRAKDPINVINKASHITELKYSDKYLLASTIDDISVIENSICTILNPGFLVNTFCIDGGMVFIGGESENIKGFACEALGRLPSFISECL